MSRLNKFHCLLCADGILSEKWFVFARFSNYIFDKYNVFLPLQMLSRTGASLELQAFMFKEVTFRATILGP